MNSFVSLKVVQDFICGLTPQDVKLVPSTVSAEAKRPKRVRQTQMHWRIGTLKRVIFSCSRRLRSLLIRHFSRLAATATVQREGYTPFIPRCLHYYYYTTDKSVTRKVRKITGSLLAILPLSGYCARS